MRLQGLLFVVYSVLVSFTRTTLSPVNISAAGFKENVKVPAEKRTFIHIIQYVKIRVFFPHDTFNTYGLYGTTIWNAHSL